ncbi:DNA repair protein RecN [Brumimicrobium oceani]|uniref:DNA repair protein RecN n=1 Tax=Brumimicrobium oceani TaxID=2100725 RepID=A0A2U2XEU9_9FLAO|nr:DNA repair protein RecN [Brumimicrobium oceani]PWH86328.1 DNA repair protein RecN [Brumimicrobium oceani]
MLKRLSVKNFALIENAQLDFKSGFAVITGETGSGKSILLGALKLILGERADYSVIRNEEKKTIVEAVFNIDESTYSDFFKTNDLDLESETIIRREIHAKGKSRAFINDTPVQLNVLKELTQGLIHIHSQHHTLSLKDAAFQRSILDVIAENTSTLISLKALYSTSKSLKRKIKSLEESKSKLELEYEFNSFQLEELSKLNLKELDYESIEKEVERGEQFEEIKSAYQMISHLINDDEEGVLTTLNKLTKNANVNDPKVQELMTRLQSVKLELNDIAANAEDDLSDMTLEPETLNTYINKLDAYNSAMRKHNLNSQEELLTLYNSLSREVEDSGQIDERIEDMTAELKVVNVKALKYAETLSSARKKVAKKLEKEVAVLLNQLKLVGATIRFHFETVELGESGTDNISLYFAPNKGMSPQVIEKSASGGELSRLMLVIQYLLSQKQQLPTVIFDEIDTGVSGEVAQKIGEHLKKMGETMQLLAITHLPQVASKGNDHILVQKRDEKGITKTYLSRLDNEQRVEEIAKLMSGSKVNEAALMNAKNLMNE